MSNFLEKLAFVKTHPFTKDVAILQIASILGKGIALITGFLFARLLGPEQYGFYTLVFALAGVINIFQEFGIGQGTINLLAKARSDDDRQEGGRVLKFFTAMSIIALGVGLVGFVVAPFLGEKFYQNRELGVLAGIVVAATALTFFLPLASIILQVLRKIETLAKLEITNKLASSLFPIIFLLLGFGVFGIVSGQFLAMISISLISFFVYVRAVRGEPFLPKISELLRVLVPREKFKNYLKFCFEIAFSKNLIKLNATVPILIAGRFLPTTSELGFYKIALAYVVLPLVLLDPVTRLLNVQFPQTEKSGTPRLMRRFLQVTMISSGIMAAVILPMIIIAPRIISSLFPDYGPSIPLIYALAAYPLLVSIGAGLGPLFRTLNKMMAVIFIQFATFLLLLPTAYFLIRNYSIMGLIVTTLTFTLIPNLLSFIYWFFIYSKNAARENLQ